MLVPASIEKIWGGERLKKDYFKKSLAEPLAESWECSTHPDGLSYISDGEYKGLSLLEVLNNNPEFLGEHFKNTSKLPILVKFIDAQNKLSIQVHPDDNYAKENENGSLGKYEMWYVLDAKEDASLIFGLHHKVDKSDIIRALENDAIEKYTQNIKVKRGDVFFVKPGTIHAIGAGILIVEIQQNSNLTYRLFDYNRFDKNGKKRELHIKKALDVADFTESPEPRQPMRILKYSPGCAKELLCVCRYFKVERLIINSDNGNNYCFSTSRISFEVFLCIDGNGIFQFGSKKIINFRKGDCVFIPANSVSIVINGKAEFLTISC